MAPKTTNSARRLFHLPTSSRASAAAAAAAGDHQQRFGHGGFGFGIWRSSSRGQPAPKSPPSTPSSYNKNHRPGNSTVKFPASNKGRDNNRNNPAWPGTHLQPKKEQVNLPTLVARESSSVALWWTVSSILLWATHQLLDNLQEPNLLISSWLSWLLSVLRFPVGGGSRTEVEGGCYACSSFLGILMFLSIHNQMKVWPNLSVRICELRIKRIRKQEFLCVALVQLCTVAILNFILAVSLGMLAASDRESPWPTLSTTEVNGESGFEDILPQAVYDAVSAVPTSPSYRTSGPSSSNSWLPSAVVEIFVTTTFVVCLLVLPVLLSLNRLPTIAVLFFLCPLLICSKSSLLVLSSSPSSMPLSSSVSSLIYSSLLPQALPNRLAQLVGGWLAGEVMTQYFPDDPKS